MIPRAVPKVCRKKTPRETHAHALLLISLSLSLSLSVYLSLSLSFFLCLSVYLSLYIVSQQVSQSVSKSYSQLASQLDFCQSVSLNKTPKFCILFFWTASISQSVRLLSVSQSVRLLPVSHSVNKTVRHFVSQSVSQSVGLLSVSQTFFSQSVWQTQSVSFQNSESSPIQIFTCVALFLKHTNLIYHNCKDFSITISLYMYLRDRDRADTVITFHPPTPHHTTRNFLRIFI